MTDGVNRLKLTTIAKPVETGVMEMKCKGAE